MSRLESELEQATGILESSQKNLEGALKKIQALEAEKVALETRLTDRDDEIKSPAARTNHRSRTRSTN